MSWLIHLLLAELRIKEYHPNISASHSERFGRTLYLEAQLIRCVLDCICFSPSSSETSFSSIVVTKCKSRIIFFFFLKREERRKESKRKEHRESWNALKFGWEIDSFICLGHIHVYDYASQSFSCHCRSLQALSVFLPLLFPFYRMGFILFCS